MLRFFMVILLLFAVQSVALNPAYIEKDIVDYAKALDVAQLDPTIPSQRLDSWLIFDSAQIEVLEWYMSDCDLKPSHADDKDKLPLCVRFGFGRKNIGGWGIITVGTYGQGIIGSAKFEYAIILANPPMRSSRTINRLSDLPKSMDELEKQAAFPNN